MKHTGIMFIIIIMAKHLLSPVVEQFVYPYLVHGRAKMEKNGMRKHQPYYR